MANIDKQLNYYESNKEEINKKYDQKYIVINEELAIVSFDRLDKAYYYGVSNFGLGKFLIKHCNANAMNAVHYVNPIIVEA